MRSSFFKILGGSLLTFAVIWALVLGWWQSNDYEPSKVDLALYLGALPLALVGGFLLLRGFIEHLKTPVMPAAPAVAIADADPLAGDKARTAAEERGFVLAVLDAFAVAPAGESADDILAAVASGKRPEPSTRLTDDAGFPIFLAEVPNLDTEAIRDRLLEDQGVLRGFADDEALLRILALLDGLVPRTREKVGELIGRSTEKLRLQIVWLVPAGFDPSDLTALRAWLHRSYWPNLELTEFDLAVVSSANEAESLRQVDEIILRTNRDPVGNELILLIAAASATNERTVEQWAGANLLFSATHQGRKIPGEGAVALLLANRRLAASLDPEASVLLSRASLGVRDKPLDAGGRIGGKLLNQLISGLLDVTHTEAAQIKTLVADTDHRANHMTEALEGLGEAFVHLDPATDCLAIGTANGAVSPISSLIALACACGKVITDQAPVLCVSNQDPTARAAMLAMPLVAENPETPRIS
nr:hypothetical protein [Dechloromonas sp.]